jgi:hypothetical protein
MITVTVSGDDADALAERLAELLAGTSVKIGPPTQLAVIAGGRAEGDEGRPPGRRRRQQSRDLAEAVAVPGQLPMPGTDR